MKQLEESVKDEKSLNNIIKIDQGQIEDQLGHLVRQSVEETINNLLDAEADQLCQAQSYERTDARKDTRAGHYQRKLHTRV